MVNFGRAFISFNGQFYSSSNRHADRLGTTTPKHSAITAIALWRIDSWIIVSPLKVFAFKTLGILIADTACFGRQMQEIASKPWGIRRVLVLLIRINWPTGVAVFFGKLAEFSLYFQHVFTIFRRIIYLVYIRNKYCQRRLRPYNAVNWASCSELK